MFGSLRLFHVVHTTPLITPHDCCSLLLPVLLRLLRSFVVPDLIVVTHCDFTLHFTLRLRLLLNSFYTDYIALPLLRFRNFVVTFTCIRLFCCCCPLIVPHVTDTGTDTRYVDALFTVVPTICSDSRLHTVPILYVEFYHTIPYRWSPLPATSYRPHFVSHFPLTCCHTYVTHGDFATTLRFTLRIGRYVHHAFSRIYANTPLHHGCSYVPTFTRCHTRCTFWRLHDFRVHRCYVDLRSDLR